MSIKNKKNKIKKSIEIITDVDSYKRGLTQVEKFKDLHPVEYVRYDLSLVPYFYQNIESIVPVTFENKRHMVRWEHFVRWRHLGNGQVNSTIQHVYLIEFIGKDGRAVYKIGVAKHIKKRFEGLNSYYKIHRAKEFGPFPSEIARNIEKKVRGLFTLQEAHVHLGVKGDKECVKEDVFTKIAQIQKIVDKYSLYKTKTLENIFGDV